MASSRSHPAAVSVFVASIVSLCATVSAVEFAGGTGEPNDPYQIATAEQLVGISAEPNLCDKHFILTADIDLDPGLPGGRIFDGAIITFYDSGTCSAREGASVACEVAMPLSGSFDGRGHVIRNFIIYNTSTAAHPALFASIGRQGRVANLHLENVLVVGISNMGGWTVYCGALAGFSAGRVVNCSATGTIIADSPAAYMGGGLVGHNRGIILNCSASCQVSGMQLGGLAGYNWGYISGCYSTGTVIGEGRCGGLVADNRGLIRTCGSVADVIAEMAAGGLVGYNLGRIVSSYAAGTVMNQLEQTGGLVGESPPLGGVEVKHSYFLDVADGGGPDNQIGMSLTAEQMRLQASYVGWDFWDAATGDKADTWFMPSGAAPVLAWQTDLTGLRVVPDVAGLPAEQARVLLIAAGFLPGDTTCDFSRAFGAGCAIHAQPDSIAPVGAVVDLVLSSGGTYDWAANPADGTAANPYQVATAGQLESLGDHPELWNKCFILIADLDMAGRMYAGPLIAPDANDVKSGFQGTAFTGTFDGRGHAIRNLSVSAGSGDYAGLFGMIEQAGQVGNLRILGACINVDEETRYPGVLVGYNKGILADCFAGGTVVGGCHSGDGLAGYNAGTQINCSADVTVVTQCLR